MKSDELSAIFIFWRQIKAGEGQARPAQEPASQPASQPATAPCRPDLVRKAKSADSSSLLTDFGRFCDTYDTFRLLPPPGGAKGSREMAPKRPQAQRSGNSGLWSDGGRGS